MSVWVAPAANPADEDTWLWEDITSYVRVGDGINISSGRRDEFSIVDASKCQLRLDNTDGRFSRFNPNSIYYGKLTLNTPLRVRWKVGSDGFGRSVSNGWGTADFGGAWTNTGGSVSDYSVNGSAGLHSNGTLNVSRVTTMPGPFDVDLTITVSMAVTATGAPFRAGLVARWTDINNHNYAYLRFNTDQTIDLRMERTVGGVVSLLDTIATGLTHTAGTVYKLRYQVTGVQHRAKVWTSATEPAAWTDTTTEAFPLTTGTSVGVRSRVDTGNTNTLPLVFTFDDFRADNDRFVGFVTEWPPRWDLSGKDASVPIVAAGSIRRLRQRESPLKSAIYRYIAAPGLPDPIEYWPCEDASDATTVGSAMDGGNPAAITGEPRLGSYTGWFASESLPVMATGSKITFQVRPYTPTSTTGVRFFAAIPADGYTAPNKQLLGAKFTGTADLWVVDYSAASSGTLLVRALNGTTELLNTTAVTGVNGKRMVIDILLQTSGADIVWDVDVYTMIDDLTVTETGGNGTLTGRTIGTLQRISATYFGEMPDTTVGHVVVVDNFLVLAGATNPILAHAGETAGSRIRRLCNEEEVPFVERAAAADLGDTTPVGAQRPGTLLDLLRQAEDADGGVLHEFGAGLTYLPRVSRYNQTAALALSKVSGHIADAPEPTDDDQQTRNDVTANRTNGSFARVVDQPHVDSEGRYDEAVTVNVSKDSLLANIAAWRVHLGTVAAMRWPKIALNLARNPSLIPSWLAFRIGNRATVAHDITQLPGVDVDLLVDGWSERIGPYSWDVELNAVPALPWQVGVLGDSPERRAETQGSQLNASVTSTATSLAVATTIGPVWTTTAGHFPFDVMIGGERITVTNITGATSPQTFTATRSANGISKAHSSGAKVELAPAYQLLAAL